MYSFFRPPKGIQCVTTKRYGKRYTVQMEHKEGALFWERIEEWGREPQKQIQQKMCEHQGREALLAATSTETVQTCPIRREQVIYILVLSQLHSILEIQYNCALKSQN